MICIDVGHFLKSFDYDELVNKMAKAGVDRMLEVVTKTLMDFPTLTYESERVYFWKALCNASRKRDIVWLWIIAYNPALDISEGLSTNPAFVPDWELPELGQDEDELDIEAEAEFFSQHVEISEENFMKQAQGLEEWFEKNAKPSSFCHNLKEYVDTFRHSGTGKISAKNQLSEGGFLALATDEGIAWLIENY